MDTVRMWMSSPAITTLHSTTLPDVRHLLQTHRIRRIPVVDEQGVLVGIVTEGDVNRVSDSDTTDIREYNLYHRIKDLPIREIMSRPVFSVEPEFPILTVAQIMLDNRISGVPVTEPVSYTHLDVYKRQGSSCAASGKSAAITTPIIG